MSNRHDITDEQFKKLLREISKRFAILGGIVILIGLAIILIMYFWMGGSRSRATPTARTSVMLLNA